jgi:hypothetical protein
LSPEGRAKFDLDFSSKRQTEYRNHKNALMTFLLGKLSTDSYTSVSSDSLFLPARASADTLTVWRLIKNSHLCGTSLSDKIHTLHSLMSSTQSTDSYESYLLKFREKVALVIANYESKEHPGLMDMDALFASLLLQGVDQTFFARRIELALENKTLPKLAALSADLQTNLFFNEDAKTFKTYRKLPY